jgi:hypothetical protein
LSAVCHNLVAGGRVPVSAHNPEKTAMASVLATLDRPSAFVTDLQDRIGAFSR